MQSNAKRRANRLDETTMRIRFDQIVQRDGRIYVKFAGSRGSNLPLKAVTIMQFDGVAEMRQQARTAVNLLQPDDLLLFKVAEILQDNTTLGQARVALEGKTFELQLVEVP